MRKIYVPKSIEVKFVVASVFVLLSLFSCTDRAIKKSDENKEIYKRLLAEMDEGNSSIADEVISADCIWHMGGMDLTGYKAFKESDSIFRIGFPDLKHGIEDLIAEGDMLAARLRNTGTHNGFFSGIKPTGEKVIITVQPIYRFEGGKIVEGWIEYDALGLMLQIGGVNYSDQSNSETD